MIENKVLKYALMYAEMGYPVFPIIRNRKTPATTHGFKDSTIDEAKIRKMFSNRHLNIGIFTGGLIVIDNDRQDGAWPSKDQALTMMDCPMAKTPREGLHSVYIQPKSGSFRSTESKLYKKIDTRADGGYIVVEPSVVDGKAYKWVSELVPRDELSEPPQWLIDELLKRSPKKSQEFFESSEQGQKKQIQKGSRHPYLVSIAGSLRNNGLDFEEIFSVIQKRNKKYCSPVLPEKDVKHIAESCSKYEPEQIRAAVVDNLAETDRQEHGLIDPGLLPVEKMRVPGFMSEVMDLCLETAPYPNEAMAFCGALSLQAHLAARKISDSSDVRTNLYLIGLAFSGSGKDWPRKLNAKILNEIGEINTLGERFASGEGIQDALFLNPALLLQTDEIDGMLNSISSDKQSRYESIVSTLLTMFSSSNSVYPMRKKSGQEHSGSIDQPSVTIFGSAIPDNYYTAINSKMVSGGLLSRFLIIEAGPRGKGQDAGPIEITDSIKAGASMWYDGTHGGGNLLNEHPKVSIVTTTPDAIDLLNEMRCECDRKYAACFDKLDEASMAVWARAFEFIKKLSLIYSASVLCHNGEINNDAVMWAYEIVIHQIKRTLFLFSKFSSESDFDSLVLKIKRIIGKAPGKKIGKRDLLRKLKIRSSEMNEALETMMQSDQIESVTIDSKTNKKTVLKLIDNLLI